MAEFNAEGVTPVYNQGVLRMPEGIKSGESRVVGAPVQIFADLLEKDIVGGQADMGFVADAGAPLAHVAGKPGHYEPIALVDAQDDPITSFSGDVAGLLLLATDAYDAPRHINVIKGGTVKTWVGALAALGDDALESLATALNGRYDAVHKTLKF